MSGLKVFEAFEILTAADVNSYLMEQSVMVFGGTAARDAAIGTATGAVEPNEGMLVYLTDLNQYQMNLDGTVSGWFPVAGQMPLAVFTRTTDQSIANNNSTTTKVTFPNQITLRGGITYSAGDFTLPLAGLYSVSVWYTYASSTAGRRFIDFRINDVAIYADNRTAPSAGAGNIAISGLVYANANDLLSTNTLQNSGGSLNLNSCAITITYLGA
jgi:hypothetical protein